MRQDLISRDFKFDVVLRRKPVGESFTPEEHARSVEVALQQIPKKLQITEVTIETEVGFVKDELEMKTTIYWKPNKE